MRRHPRGRSPASISKYLRGIVFPAHKADLFRHAQHQGAEDTLLGVIELLPDGNYHCMADVIVGAGRVE